MALVVSVKFEGQVILFCRLHTVVKVSEAYVEGGVKEVAVEVEAEAEEA